MGPKITLPPNLGDARPRNYAEPQRLTTPRQPIQATRVQLTVDWHTTVIGLEDGGHTRGWERLPGEGEESKQSRATDTMQEITRLEAAHELVPLTHSQYAITTLGISSTARSQRGQRSHSLGWIGGGAHRLRSATFTEEERTAVQEKRWSSILLLVRHVGTHTRVCAGRRVSHCPTLLSNPHHRPPHSVCCNQ